MMTSPLHLLLMSVLIAACQSCPPSYKYSFDVSVQSGNNHDASTDGDVKISWLNRGRDKYSNYIGLGIQGIDDFEQGDRDIYHVKSNYPSYDVVKVCALLVGTQVSDWQLHEICFRNIRRCFVFDAFIAPGSYKCSTTWRRY